MAEPDMKELLREAKRCREKLDERELEGEDNYYKAGIAYYKAATKRLQEKI